jgi:molybdenum cofactor cytidylyltransferase
MHFGPCPTARAQGAILAHSQRAGSRLLRKGRVLADADIAALIEAGVQEVVVARLEDGDMAEDEAARRIATAAAGEEVRVGGAFTGRANLYARADGVAVVDAGRVDALNAVDEAITLATVAPFARVGARQILATAKIIPFAAPRASVAAAERLLGEGPLVRVAPFRPWHAALVSTVLPGTKPALLDKNRAAIEARLAAVGSRLVLERRVAHETAALAEAIREAKGCDPILIFGASAITDRRDVIPAAIEAVGGTIDAFGMPVDPGNLLLAARLDGAAVIGLPGCARSPKQNGFDFVLWRLAAGLAVGRAEIARMGAGGLLGEIPTRPQPRDERPAELPKVAAIVLAAGGSSRMGANKLLMDIGGKPMVRHAVEAALGSAARPVLVVTGNAAGEVRKALEGLPIQFVENFDFSRGLSASLKSGVSALPQDCDGAAILLGDMPGITAGLVDMLIAAFDPGEGRAICVASRHGRQGNPVLWARRFFPEMAAIEGDVGAKALLDAYAELVCEIDAGDDSVLADIDTQEALTAYRAR